MKVLILTRFANEYEPKRLASVGRAAGHLVDIVKYGKIGIQVTDDGEVGIDLGEGKNLADYDLIVPRSASKNGSSMVAIKTIILAEAKRLSIKIVNGESFARYPLLGKTEQGVMMAEAGLPVSPLVTFGSKRGWQIFEKSEPKFPLMVKGRFGSHGRTVQKVEDMTSLKELVAKYKEGNVLLQPVLPIKVWYRSIVANGKYLGEMKHKQKEKYLSGTVATESKLDDRDMGRLEEICLKAAALFDCDYAGIDVGYSEEKKDWIIFEVNRTAQFKYFEKRTGVDVAFQLLG